MSYPILYDSTESDFNHNGKGILSDCISCQVTEEANGKFEMTIKYPSDGIHFDQIEGRSLLKVKVDQYREPQLFRVYEIKKDMGKNATIYAEHISYDLSGIPVRPYAAPHVYGALMMLKDGAVVPCPFDFWTDKNTEGVFKVTAPASVRSRLGGVQGSILDVYGGEYEFDNFTVKLHNRRGKNRGFSIRYGKNLIDFDQEKNCSSVATGIYPYWADAESGKVVQLDEKIINADGNYNFVRIKTVDFSADFETEPTQQQLREKAQKYVKNNEIGIPKVSLKISFAQLSQSEEYKGIELAERISLFDTVNVEFPEMGVSANARVNKIVYDIVKDKIKSATLGSIRANIADTLSKQDEKMEETAKIEASKAVNSQTSADIFNRLTDYGRIQGFYIDEDKWYINAEVARIINLIAEKLRSRKDFSSLNIDGASISLYSDEKETFAVNNYDDSASGSSAFCYFTEYDENGNISSQSQLCARWLALGGTWMNPILLLSISSDNKPRLHLKGSGKDESLEISWKDNGDGTYTLIGQ